MSQDIVCVYVWVYSAFANEYSTEINEHRTIRDGTRSQQKLDILEQLVIVFRYRATLRRSSDTYTATFFVFVLSISRLSCESKRAQTQEN